MPAGRPKVQIDKTEFEKLCHIQCTKREIAEWFGCSEDTIERWCKREYDENFAVIFEKKRSFGKISLRRIQWQLAERNATMAIFLGKQYLGQTDNMVIKADVTEDDPITKSLKEEFADVLTETETNS